MAFDISTFRIRDVSWGSITWENFYNLLGIKEFIYFISSASIQDSLFPIKLVFIFFAAFFFCVVIWFYLNSSYLKYQFLQDTTEFLFQQNYGLRQVNKSWKKIKKRIDLGTMADLKLAIIEADDFLYETMQDAGYEGVTFEELLQHAATKKISHLDSMPDAHAIRNSIVYDPAYNLDTDNAKEILGFYESAIKNIASA